MSALSRKNLAQNLATSLSLCRWDYESLSSCLTRRLPHKLQPLSAKLAEELLIFFPGQIAPTKYAIARELAGTTSFSKVLAYCVKHDSWPNPDLSAGQMQPIAAFIHLDLPQLTTTSALAGWFGLTHDRLRYYADCAGRHEAHGDMAVNNYHYHLSAKAKVGQRLIEAPKPRLKALQRQIMRNILDQVRPHAAATGFVKGRGCVMGAAVHVGEQVVVSFDLKDFFPRIAAKRVFGLFRALGYPPEVAHMLTGLCSNTTPARIRDRMPYPARQIFREAHLPQGAPTSPSLANLISFRLDCRLSALAQSLDAHYTRYADDLTFSGDRRIARVLLSTVPEIARDAGFAMNNQKTRVMADTRRQRITGIVVNEHLNVPRKEYDQLKAIIHACRKPGDMRWADPTFRAHLDGRIAWVAQVNPARAAKLRNLMAQSAA